MRTCTVKFLAIKFINEHSTTVLEYTNLISDTKFCFETKIRIDLSGCNMSDTKAVELFSPTTNRLSCIRIMETKLSNEFLKALANQLTALDSIVLPNWHEERYYSSRSLPPINYTISLPSLCQATQLRVLHLNKFPEKCDFYLRAMLPNFSNLQEIQLDSYSQLTALPNLSSLTFLQIGQKYAGMKKPEYKPFNTNLLQLITDNRHTLRAAMLYEIHCSGLRSCRMLLNVVSLCTKLFQLVLHGITISADDDTSEWSIIGNNQKLLAILELRSVSLYDTGFESLCTGLAYHPTIMELRVVRANLTSLSCNPLIHLIPTVAQLEKLHVSDLKKPDREPYQLLQQTVDDCSIELNQY